MTNRLSYLERFSKSFILMLALVLFPAFTYAQIKVSGTVVDENDEPLIGVSVVEEGNTTGTVTDIDGNFYITVKEIGRAHV